jgi:alanine racemase
MYRPTWVEISHPAFRYNIRQLRSLIHKKTKILAVVKANAYGHLAVPLSKLALQNGADALGVASIEEGITLREAGIAGPVLILGSIYPLENLAAAAEYRLIPTISSQKGLNELAHLGGRLKRPLPFHLKVDTGMGRIGITPATAEGMLEKILSHRREVSLAGIYTHFSSADVDAAYTREQLKKFSSVVAHARRLGLEFAAHAASSAAILCFPQAHFDMVRPGICLYGLLPFAGAERKVHLKPVLSWKTRIVFLKRVPRGTCVGYCRTFITKKASVIATLPVGYADGYDRALSNKGKVLVGGRRCAVIGRVSMDMITVDVTGVKGVAIGDEAVLVGSQGKERVSAEEMASWTGTINYEVTCGIGYRVPRVLI